MAVIATDIQFRLSGGSGNSDPEASLGGVMSSNSVVGSPTTNNIFDNVTADEALAGDINYRCIYILNSNTVDGLISGKVWIESNTPSADTNIAIGLDPAGVGDGSTTGVATTIADEDTAPSGVTFSSPATEGAALAIPAMTASQGIALWVRRTVTEEAEPVTSDPFTITFKGSPA